MQGFGFRYRDVEELLGERGITVDHVSVYRWVQRFTPLLIDAARPRRHATGDRWFVDETDVRVAGRWIYLYRAIDQFGQVMDVLVSEKRDLAATRRFFTGALQHGPRPSEVSTDHAPAYPRVVDELLPAARHVIERYGNNPIESDHGRLKSRLWPMRGLKRLRSTRIISAGQHLSRTCAAATTSSALIPTPDTGSPRPSPSSPSPSKQEGCFGIEHVLPPANATAPAQVVDRTLPGHRPDWPVSGLTGDTLPCVSASTIWTMVGRFCQLIRVSA